MSLDALVGGDGSNVPLLKNFRETGKELKKTFWDQPNIGRMLAPWVKPTQFDGKTEHETVTYEDVDDVEFSMVPGESHTDLEGDTVITKMPQIYKTCRDLVDNWRREFGPEGTQRVPTLMGRLKEKVKNKEDFIIFNGDIKEQVLGLKAAGHQIDSAGSWLDDTDADGIKENMKEDFRNIRTYFSNLGLGKYKIDFAITFPAYDFMDDIDLPARSDSMMDLIKAKEYVGEILPSNNVSPTAPVTGDNVLIGIPRIETDAAGWGLISSGIEDEAFRDTIWTWIYAVREKFNVEIVIPELIAVIDDIVLT
jgi:hypothetical protein